MTLNDKQRAQLDRLTLANMKLKKRNEEIRAEVNRARQGLKQIQERARQRAIRLNTQEKLLDLGVLMIPKSDKD